jgi:hypothetical protein
VSEVIYEAVEIIVKNEVGLASTGNIGGSTIIAYAPNLVRLEKISGKVNGVDYKDAQDGINELIKDCMSGGVKEILGICGRVVEMRTKVAPASKFQKFTITLETVREMI